MGGYQNLIIRILEGEDVVVFKDILKFKNSTIFHFQDNTHRHSP